MSLILKSSRTILPCPLREKLTWIVSQMLFSTLLNNYVTCTYTWTQTGIKKSHLGLPPAPSLPWIFGTSYPKCCFSELLLTVITSNLSWRAVERKCHESIQCKNEGPSSVAHLRISKLSFWGALSIWYWIDEQDSSMLLGSDSVIYQSAGADLVRVGKSSLALACHCHWGPLISSQTLNPTIFSCNTGLRHTFKISFIVEPTS